MRRGDEKGDEKRDQKRIPADPLWKPEEKPNSGDAALRARNVCAKVRNLALNGQKEPMASTLVRVRTHSRSLVVLLSLGAAVACGASGDAPVVDAELDSPTDDPNVDGVSRVEGTDDSTRLSRLDITDSSRDLPQVPPIGSLRATVAELTLAPNTVQSGFTGDLVTWKDSAGQNRTAFLPNPSATQDPAGVYGGYLRTFTYVTGGVTRTMNPSTTEPGFGFVYGQKTSDFTVVSSKYAVGTRSVRSVGPNHVVLEYTYPTLKTAAGVVFPLKATVQWAFVTGRDYPTYAVTHDSSAVAANVNDLNAQAPYGGLEFTGTAGTTIDGVGWGDRYKFVTTTTPLSMNSSWTYNAVNVVPYVQSWNNSKNAEMGLVQTERYARHDGGYGQFFSNWNQTSATKVVDSGAPASQTMPINWNWTFLIDQWQLPDAKPKVLGWGLNFGAVGKSSAAKYGGGTLSGYPYQSYAVSIVLGPKTSVTSQVAQQERVTASSITASRGTVVTSGPGGAGRTDNVTYSPVGYDQIYGTFDLKAEVTTGALVAAFDPKLKAIKNPTFRILDYPLTTDPTAVRMNTTNLVEGTDYAVSRDGTTLWFVLKKTISAVTTIAFNEGAPPPPPPPPPTWADIAIDPAQSVGGFTSDVFRWRDAQNKERSAALVRNNALDPAGYYGGYARRFTYVKSDGSTLTASGGHVAQNPGWGYTLHHQDPGQDRDTMSSRRAPGTYRQVFVGKHHAIHEYSWNILRTQGDVPAGFPPVDKPIKVTVRWVFANGKDGPVWIHTVDSSGIAANSMNADDRSPAGELTFDGSDTGVVSGAGWGDHYRFTTTSAPLSMNSTWDYTVPNRAPYARLWSDATNTELGNVQQWDWQHKDAGYGWFYPNWGRTSANKIVSDGAPATQNMPADWNWTYQLNQYEIPSDGASKRLNWGTNFGSVGKTSYSAYSYDRNDSGYPYAARSTRMVLGPKGSTIAEVDQVTRSLGVTLTATEGTVVTSGPKGLGAAAGTLETFSPPGWNHVYGVFELVARSSDGGINVDIDTSGQDLVNPVFRLKAWTQALPATISLGGATLNKDVDFLPSLVTNEGSPELWLTILRTVRGPINLQVSPKGALPPPPPPPLQGFTNINHILSTGQSNSVFSGGVPVLTTTQPYANVGFNVGVFPATQCDGNGCKSYAVPNSFIPLVEGDAFFNPVETMSSGMANQITRGARIFLAGQPAPQNDHRVLVSIHGRSGNTYHCLRKSGCAFLEPTYVRPFSEGMLQVQWGKQIANALGQTYAVRAVTAIHGESDHYTPDFPLAGSDGTPNKIQTYADAMVEWQEDYESGVKAITGQAGVVPLLMAQMHSWSGDSRTTSRIPTDQYDAMIRAPGKVTIVAPEYPLTYDSSGIHFNSPSGRRLGEYFAKAYSKIVVEGQAWEPVRPKTITRSANVITITYHVPVPPLALDTSQVTNPGNYGFEYGDDTGAAAPAITNVQVIAADTVRITLASTPTGANKRVRYAYTSRPNTQPGKDFGVRGNLRDSDPTPSLYGNALQNWGVTFNLAAP